MVHTAHRWRLPVALGALLVLGTAGWWWRGRSATTAGAHYAYETALIDRGPIRAQVTATGAVNPTVQVQVGTQVSGTIQKLGADFNSTVEPGQMIAQIDPRLFRAAVAQARANLVAAHANVHRMRAQLTDAERTATRNHELYTQNLLAKATADTSATAAEVARAAVEQAVAAEVQARAALDTATLNLEFSTIRSPIHGTVITRNVDVGQTVAASFASPTLFLIGEDLTKMEVDTSIAEADVGSLTPGLVATFTVDAYPARIFRGTIRQVRTSPQVVQNVVTYNAVIDVANPKLELRPGMTANLEIVYAERTDVVRVPNAALRFHPPADLVGATAPLPPQGKKLVWVLRAGTLAPVVVDVGVRDGSYTEILGGLAVGDLVVTEATGGKATSAVRSIL
jgi:HlyD family secretion protein